jgi:hypothetical protein
MRGAGPLDADGRLMQTPSIFLAYEPRPGGLHCALAYFKSGGDAYGWFTGPRRDASVASCYFLLEDFYANAPGRYEAVDHADLHSAWLLDERRRHELAQMQERFANGWLLNWQEGEVGVRAERLEKFSRLHAPWTFYSPGFARPVLKHLARQWPLAYRLDVERIAAAQKLRIATRARV